MDYPQPACLDGFPGPRSCIAGVVLCVHCCLRGCAVGMFLIGAPLSGQDQAPDDAEATRGLKKPAAAGAPKRYPKTWALVIGVDYAERMDVERIHLPALRNAQRDAQLVEEMLYQVLRV